MITESSIYWITRLDYIVFLMEFSIVFSIAGGVAVLIGAAYAHDDDNDVVAKNLVRVAIGLAIATGLAGVGRILIPTTKEMAAIKILPRIAQNEQIQEIPAKLVELTDEWIDSLILRGDSK